MRMRLGIMGGMFDPVHNAHIAAARFAVEQLNLNELHLVPCHVPNHRAQAVSAPGHRVAMLELAIKSEPGMMVNPLEIERDQTSYSVDTLRAIHQAYPAARLVFILGMDAFNSFTQWHQWENILELCHLFVIPRAGIAATESTKTTMDFSQRNVQSADLMFLRSAGNIYMARDFRVDLSSTDVRKAIKQQQDLTTLLDARVVEYINQHNLYNQQ